MAKFQSQLFRKLSRHIINVFSYVMCPICFEAKKWREFLPLAYFGNLIGHRYCGIVQNEKRKYYSSTRNFFIISCRLPFSDAAFIQALNCSSLKLSAYLSPQLMNSVP